MNCTINVINKALSECNPYIEYSNPNVKKYENWAFLTEKTAQISSGWILIDAGYNPDVYAHCLNINNCIICKRNSDSVFFLKNSGCSLILIDGKSDIPEIGNCLQSMFDRLHRWDDRLNRVLSEIGGSQELLDVSEEVIDKPMAFITESLQIPSYTKEHRIPYPGLYENFQNIKISPSVVWSIKEKGYIDRIFPQKDSFILLYADHIGCNVLCRSLPDNAFMKVLALYFCREEDAGYYSDLLENLYEYAIKAIQLKSGFSRDKIRQEREDLLVANAIEGNITDKEMDAHGLMLNINPYGRFHLYLIDFESSSETKQKFILQTVRENLNGIKAYPYEDKIVLFEESTEFDLEKHLNTEKYLEGLLLNSGAACGIGIFSQWTNVRFGYAKAKAAAELGREKNRNEVIFRFRDYLLPYMLNLLSEEMPLDKVYMNELDRLMEYDKKHGSNNLELLKLYLQEERNVNEISRKTHLHRNSVRYRIDKIEDILNVSLDNNENRFNLMLSLKLLEYDNENRKNGYDTQKRH